MLDSATLYIFIDRANEIVSPILLSKKEADGYKRLHDKADKLELLTVAEYIDNSSCGLMGKHQVANLVQKLLALSAKPTRRGKAI